jgi:hypothetical protein
MRNFSNHIAFLLILVFISLSSYAQDVGTPSFETYDSDPLAIKDKYAFTASADPTDPPRNGSAQKDSVASKAVRNVYKPSPVVPKSENEDDQANDNSLLSFNFLYYLIQKYKMQDIVD